MSLSIIIVNYNTQHYIAQTIESILRSKDYDNYIKNLLNNG